MTTTSRLDAVLGEGVVPVVGLGLALFVVGAVVQRAETADLGGQVVLGLVPVASLAASAWWEARGGDPLSGLALGVAPFLGYAALSAYAMLTAGATATYPLQLLLFVGLLVGAGGYALGILWEDVTPALTDGAS
jgi:hypothetical protein